MLPETEKDSHYQNLSELNTAGILHAISTEDHKVAPAVAAELHAIEALVNRVCDNLSKGGRLFYIGAGTSGRLGILDASECPPTYGVPAELVTGIIAGGDSAIRKAVEFAEDNTEQAMNDLLMQGLQQGDFVVGISASGRTPYVLGGLQACREAGIDTGCICCSKKSAIGIASDFPVEVDCGPEVITGSTRMKSGTAQKMVLNMITTTTMVKLGKVKGSKMVHMQLSNDKLIDRGTRMIVEQTGLEYDHAKDLLIRAGSVAEALEHYKNKP